MAEQTYDDSSIDVMLGARRVKERASVMLGTTGLEGAQHCVSEILGNSCDEAEAGYGTELIIQTYEDGSISIRDFGRGVPLGWNERVRHWNWHNVYNELYGGGKYNENQDILAQVTDWNNFNPKSINYLFSVGLNGLGGASTQYTSEFFIVESYRDGKVTSMRFENGYPVFNGEPIDMFSRSEVINLEDYAPHVEDTTEPNGTFIRWKPSDQVFSDINITDNWIDDLCKYTANIARIKITFKTRKGKEKVYESGDTAVLLKDYVKKIAVLGEDDEPIIDTFESLTHGTTLVNNKQQIYVCKATVSMAYTDGYRQTLCYHNNVKTAGKPEGAIAQAVGDFFREVSRSSGYKLENRDYEGVLTFCVSSYSNLADWQGQTKNEIYNPFVFDTIYDMVLQHLRQEYGKGVPQLTTAVEKVIREAQTRIQIKELSKQVREHNKILKQEKPEKFTTCVSYDKKNPAVSELWITEGDSAKMCVKKARDKNFQAIFPIRGKILNVLKAPLEKILKNQEISGIFGIIGTGMDLGTRDIENTFDISKLRFDKIIFATDADEDGFQIRVLLFLIFYKLAPELLRQGNIYIAATPKYALKFADGSTQYALDDREKEVIVKQYGTPTNISRFKGLGEMPPEILRRTTVDPQTRYPLIRLKLDCNNAIARKYIDVLFGEDKFHERKHFLAQILGIESSVLSDEFDLNSMEMELGLDEEEPADILEA